MALRFTPDQAAVLKEEAKRLGSTTTFVRQLLDDYRTLSGLPEIWRSNLPPKPPLSANPGRSATLFANARRSGRQLLEAT